MDQLVAVPAPPPADAAVRPQLRGWRVMRSDAGRLWATRERPFPRVAEEAGASRTVDADSAEALAEVVAAQESLAEQVAA